jgi:multidrug efflux pump subunit AcrB
MAAFFPLLFMISGIIGRYLSILPKVVLFALCASLFEVFFMLPSHVVELTPAKATVKIRSRRRIDVFAPLRRIYYPYLRLILRHRYISVMVIVLSTILAFVLYFQTDFEMFPKSDAFPQFNINIDMPIGATLERTSDTLLALTDVVREGVGQDLEAVIAVSGLKEVNYEPIRGPQYGILYVILKDPDERNHKVKEILENIRGDVGDLLRSRGSVSFVLERLLEGPPVGADVDLKIQSPDWETSAQIARLIQEELAKHEGIVDIQDDYSREKQFMEITVDEAKAKALGINQAYLVSAVQAGFYGLTVGTYNQGGEEQEIKLKYLPEYREDLGDLVNLKIAVPSYGEIPLGEVADVRMAPGFHNIYHYNGKPTVRVTANIKSVQDEAQGMANLGGRKMTAVRANAIARACFEGIKADFPGARMIAGGLQDETET